MPLSRGKMRKINNRINRSALGVILGILIISINIPFLFGDSFSEDQNVAILRNRLASIEDRIKAIDELKAGNHPDLIPNLIVLFKGDPEPMSLLSHAIDTLIEIENPKAIQELKGLIADTQIGAQKKNTILYALWKSDPETIKPDIFKILKNSNEDNQLRAAAIEYYSHYEKIENPSPWIGIITNKSNADTLRIAAIHAMKRTGELEITPAILTTIIQNKTESVFLRKSVLLISTDLIPPASFELQLFQLLSDNQNPLDIRRYAIELIRAEGKASLIPKLRNIQSKEGNTQFATELDLLIEYLTALQRRSV